MGRGGRDEGKGGRGESCRKYRLAKKMAAAIAIPVDFPEPGTAETAKGPPCQSAIRCCPGRNP